MRTISMTRPRPGTIVKVSLDSVHGMLKGESPLLTVEVDYFWQRLREPSIGTLRDVRLAWAKALSPEHLLVVEYPVVFLCGGKRVNIKNPRAMEHLRAGRYIL